MNTLCHGFAIHLLEQSTDLRYIQALRGQSSKTTGIYTLVTPRNLGAYHQPFG
jgi:site-specific recombinase XerD